MTDGIASLLNEQQVLAYRYQGVRYDCGSKLGYLQAQVEYGMNHAKLGGPFRQYLMELLAAGAVQSPEPAVTPSRRKKG